MKVLLTGACGFVGSALIKAWAERGAGHVLYGFDNLSRPGSELNRQKLRKLGVKLFHGDLRNTSDLEGLPEVDWVIDAAANPSVLAGVDGQSSSRQLVEHNLIGTVNMLEYCKARRAGFILLSTSRVYAIEPLATLRVEPSEGAYAPVEEQAWPVGLGPEGVSEAFSTQAPVSLYGATKLASEALALEYGETFGLPVWVNRCGVLAGAGQFGRPDQGIFAYWINAWLRRQRLVYIGFDGQGHQVRDCLDPRDVVPLLNVQMVHNGQGKRRVQNVSGGRASAHSLRQLSAWCQERFGAHEVGTQAENRPFDIPWMVLDASLARAQWGWEPQTRPEVIFEAIAQHAEAHPDWLELSRP